MKHLKLTLGLCVFALIFFLSSCEDDAETRSGENKITSFKLPLTPEVTGSIAGDQITLTVPSGTDVTALAPAIEISPKASISPASGTAVDFTNPVTYTVTAENGDAQNYTVTVSVAKSSAKSITAFKFSGLIPEVNGTVAEAEKKVSITVPNGTAVTALVPTISLSEKATVSPASGVAKDFTTPVTYTVTAEDGSTQNYQVTVIIDPNVSFTITPHVGSLDIEQDGFLFVYGTGFGDDYTKNKIVLISDADATVAHELPALSISAATAVIVKIPADFALGKYKVKLLIGQQSKMMTEVFNVTVHGPEISGVDKTTVHKEDEITITGKYFAATGNEVSLQKGSTKTLPLITSQSGTTIKFKIPSTIDLGEYTLSVKSNGKTANYATKIKVEVSPNAPAITSINKTSFAQGETIVITGVNLRSTTAVTNINFLPMGGGITLVRTGVVNLAGTEVTYSIPGTFTTGTYSIAIEVDGEFSEEYDEFIQITP